MRELSLFSGAGLGLLATQHLLGWQCVGYVEIDDYCQRVLVARIKDGYLPEAPIFGDIKAFTDQGFAKAYKGLVDVITAGFPCQPFSVAGKREGALDSRNLWPETYRVLCSVRPRYALLENVPGLLAGSPGYFGTILTDLAQAGYDVRWGIVSAANAGAPHLRKRLWIVAAQGSISNTSQRGIRKQRERYREQCSEQGASITVDDGPQGTVANANEGGQQGQWEPEHSGEQSPWGDKPDGRGQGRRWDGEKVADSESDGRDTPAITRDRYDKEARGERQGRPWRIRCGRWWATEPDVGRVAEGVPSWVDRLRALGNGQVSAVVRLAWEVMT